MRNILLLVIFFLISTFSNATHIVGGSLTYEHLGGSSYNVKLKLYRDCDPSSVNFPNSVRVEVRLGSGGTTANTSLDFVMPRLGRTVLDPQIDTCAVNPGICVEEAIFSKIVSLPPSASGYHLFVNYCCRNGSIVNITDPLNQGEAFNTYIPNMGTLLTNSSPTWTNFPPVFVCQGMDLNFNHAATDADGDSLVYSLYTPYIGYDYGSADWNTFFPTFSAASPPDNIQFSEVPWEPGFSANNPLNAVSGNNITISNTGLLSGVPEAIGQYVVGIKCEEYRDGVKIGVIVRDFQFNVVYCPPLKEAAIAPITACSGLAVQFQNASTNGANGFFWDFGDLSVTTDTSYSENPSYSYPAQGDYLVTLIAQEGTQCADTATYLLKVAGVTASMPALDSTCINTTVNFTENSVPTNTTINSWQWDFNSTGSSNVPNPSYAFQNSGDLDVTLIVGTDAGCFDTITEQIFIQGLPTVNVGPDTTACFNNPNIQLNGVITNAGGGFWVGDGGTFNPNTTDLNANYDPAAGELATGFSELVLSSTDNGFCPSSQDTLVITYIAGPTVDAGPDIQVCKDTASVPMAGSVQFAGGLQWYTLNGTGTFDDINDPNTLYNPSTADTSLGAIRIYVRSIINGNCFEALDSLELTFFDPPTVGIVADDTLCTGKLAYLNSNSTTGNGYWETFGDGAFMPDTSVTTSYTHGVNDEANGDVTIVFHSLDNGGCQVKRDTFLLQIIPSPDPQFDFTTECFGTPTVFTNNSTAPDPIAGYSWEYQGTEFSTDANPAYVIPAEDTSDITLIVTSTNGCIDTLIQPVPVNYLPQVAFSTPAPCLNGGTEYFDNTVVPDGTATGWAWSFGDSETASTQNVFHQYPSAGDFNVQLVVTSNHGCVDSLTQTITILPGPDAAFVADPSTAYVFQEINFTDQTVSPEPIISWDWDFGDGQFDNNQNTTHDYENGGQFEVILIVEDDQGCIDTAKNIVNIFLPPLVPTGFSPNGDLENDVLFVYGGPFETLSFKVYNNWGEVIFESNDQSIGWDGTYKGIEQPIGVYVWTVDATTSDGSEHELSGDTSLIK